MDAKTPDIQPDTTGLHVAEMLANDRERQQVLFRHAFLRFQFSNEEIQELLQETLVELMQVGRPVTNPEGLVRRIFHVRCLRLLARKKSRAEVSPLEDEPPNPMNLSRRIHDHLLVRQGFARISRLCRDILISHYIHGTSMRETAERVERAYSGISKLISRCLRRLRECLEP
ncbi:MAG: sigma-70 family RNA polymerase sigma factor [Acidobacteria bacterium]|nr:sigma-70 family RNA polymerase sigma factor [Acidobacteriota bacterium]